MLDQANLRHATADEIARTLSFALRFDGHRVSVAAVPHSNSVEICASRGSWKPNPPRTS
jgi:hypothetical protein